jgi:hypothetical protein
MALYVRANVCRAHLAKGSLDKIVNLGKKCEPAINPIFSGLAVLYREKPPGQIAIEKLDKTRKIQGESPQASRQPLP